MMSEREWSNIRLRDVEVDDLPIFFEYQCDPDANYMAAFKSKDPTNREAFMAHWARILDGGTTVNQTILYNEQVVGHISSYPYEDDEKPEVSYWLDQAYWGRSIATGALSTFLSRIQDRPVHARRRQRCFLADPGEMGARAHRYQPRFCQCAGQEIEEVLLQLY